MTKTVTHLVAWIVLIHLVSCGRSELEHPEEVLTRVELGCPSVLGYVRIAADRLPGEFPSLSSDLPAENLPLDLSLPLADLLLPQCRPGTHLVAILVDPEIFGAPLALCFVPREKGGLVRVLDGDTRFERVAGSEPPEYTRRTEQGLHQRLMGMLNVLGITGPWADLGGFERFLVEETDHGTLIMPSYDLRGDFLEFLKTTDRLRPWGDADVVINLEIMRLAQAYAEWIKAWNETYRNFLGRIEQSYAREHAEFMPLLRFGRFLPTLFLESVKAVKGVRFVAGGSGDHAAQLSIETVPGTLAAEFLSALREDEADLIGLVPAGCAMQWNIDPADLGGLLRRGLAFYGDDVGIDPEDRNDPVRSLLTALAGDEGRYLLGAGWIPEGFFATTMAAREGAQLGPLRPGARFEALMGILFPGLDVVVSDRRKTEGVVCIENPWPGFGEAGPLGPALESAAGEKIELSSLTFGDGFAPGRLSSKLKRLSASGMGRLPRLPDRARLIVRLALPLSLIPGIENTIPHEIMGFGLVENNRLTVRFLPDF